MKYKKNCFINICIFAVDKVTHHYNFQQISMVNIVANDICLYSKFVDIYLIIRKTAGSHSENSVKIGLICLENVEQIEI